MKKATKYLIGIGITAVLLLCTFLYFRPISLSNIADQGTQIQITLKEYIIENGKPNIDATDYQNMTEEKHHEILSVFDKYPYQRTFGTLFSDGILSGSWDKILYIYMDGDVVAVTPTGKIAINDKIYSMDNAEQFIHQIIEIAK